MRIAWIGSRGVPARAELGGGIERAVEELGSRLAARGHEVTVYCRSYYTREVSEYAGMRRVVLPTIRSKHLDTIVHTALATAHSLTCSYDIVQYFAFGPSLFAWAPRIRGMRSVASVRTLEWQREKWGLIARAILRLGERAAVYCPDVTTTVSQPIKEYLERRYSRTVTHIPNGVSAPTLRPPHRITTLGLAPNGYVLFVGRLVPEKGCHDLLRAFSRVRTDKSLVLAGAPSYSEAYAAELRQLADQRIHFVGHVTGEFLEELYSNAYVYVQPSYVEGMSNSLLEALAYQRCVLASDIPENLAVIGGYGVTFRCGDVDDLEHNLRTLLDQSPAVEERGKRAGEYVLRCHSWETVADATESLYYSLMRDSRHRYREPPSRD